PARLQAQDLAARRNLDGRSRRSIHDAHDDRGLAAVQEKMLYGVREMTEWAMSAEMTPILVEAAQCNRLVDGASLGSAEKCRNGGCSEGNGVGAFGTMR